MEWGIAEGQFFDCWRSDLHIVKPFKIPDEWIRFRAMDWGSYHPYAVLWFAVDYDGNLWCYRELYGWGGKPNVGTKETAEQVAQHIVDAEAKNEKISYAVLDNACWAATGVTGPSIAEAINSVLWKNKRTMFIECSKGREAGAEQFKQHLIGYEDSSGKQIPAIRFFNTCLNSIRTIPMLTHDKHQPEKYDTQGEDHCFIAGTMVTTARGDVPIEEVTTSDYVLTRKGYRPVAAANMTRRNAPVMTLVASNGKTLTGTGNHPVYINGKGFINLADIKRGDEFSCIGSRSAAVITTTPTGTADVYNLTVSGEPEYFANGFLVHNCADTVIYACLSRPYAPRKPSEKTYHRDRYKESSNPSCWSM